MPNKPKSVAERKRLQRQNDLRLMLTTPVNRLTEDLCLKILQLPVSQQRLHLDRVHAAYLLLGLHRGYLSSSEGRFVVNVE